MRRERNLKIICEFHRGEYSSSSHRDIIGINSKVVPKGSKISGTRRSAFLLETYSERNFHLKVTSSMKLINENKIKADTTIIAAVMCGDIHRHVQLISVKSQQGLHRGKS